MENTQVQKAEETPIHPPKRKQRCRRRAGPHGERGLYSTVVEQRMTVEQLCRGGGVSQLLQLTPELIVNSFIITTPTLAGEHMLLIPKVSILSEQTKFTSVVNKDVAEFFLLD